MNNVGTNIRSPTAEYSDEDYRFIMATNLDSAFLLTKVWSPYIIAQSYIATHLILTDSVLYCMGSIPGGVLQASYPHLKRSGKASVLLISSIAGGPSTVNSGAPYAATKGESARNYLLPLCIEGLKLHAKLAMLVHHWHSTGLY